MLELPEEYELIGFFECEPQLADKQIPWCYNNLIFTLSREQDIVRCEITPSYGELKLSWKQNGLQRADFQLNHLKGLSVHLGAHDEYMTVTGEGTEPSVIMKLRVKPFVSIEFVSLHEFG